MSKLDEMVIRFLELQETQLVILKSYSEKNKTNSLFELNIILEEMEELLSRIEVYRKINSTNKENL